MKENTKGIREMEKSNLLDMLKTHTVDEIASHFNISRSPVQRELRKRFKYGIHKTNCRERYIPVEAKRNRHTFKNKPWIDSKEREFFLKHMKSKYNENIGSWRESLIV